jgi:hypothetical protein
VLPLFLLFFLFIIPDDKRLPFIIMLIFSSEIVIYKKIYLHIYENMAQFGYGSEASNTVLVFSTKIASLSFDHPETLCSFN